MYTTNRPTADATEEVWGGYFPALDHGFVSLVDYIRGDAASARAARVSYQFGSSHDCSIPVTPVTDRVATARFHSTPPTG